MYIYYKVKIMLTRFVLKIGNINQSLLALGRVITSLSEHAGHIPYR